MFTFDHKALFEEEALKAGLDLEADGNGEYECGHTRRAWDWWSLAADAVVKHCLSSSPQKSLEALLEVVSKERRLTERVFKELTELRTQVQALNQSMPQTNCDARKLIQRRRLLDKIQKYGQAYAGLYFSIERQELLQEISDDLDRY